MSKPLKPFVISRRSDTKTFLITLNTTSGLPAHICANWRRKSFQNFPEQLSHYFNPQNKTDAERAAIDLINYLKKSETEKGTVKAFISYSTIDKITAGKLKYELSKYNIDSFLAHEDLEVSAEWQIEIIENLKKSALFICLLSENYLKSNFCMQESGMAEILNLTIIPLSLDSTKSPGFLSKYQSKKIYPLNPLISDIFPALLKHNKNEGINIIIDFIGESRGYRSAEENFEYILPYFNDLTKNQALSLIDKMLNNNQIYNAGLCSKKYIPEVVKTYKRFFTKIEYQKIKEKCILHSVPIQ